MDPGILEVSMKAIIHVRPGADHQIGHAGALSAGLGRHGVTVETVDRFDPRRLRGAGASFAVAWGWRSARRYADLGMKVLVMERGYVGDRFAWTSLGWDGLNGRARFPIVDDPVRWERLFADLLRPMTRVSGYALILGQVTGDMAVERVKLPQFYELAADRARNCGLEPVFRPHPESARRGGAAAPPGVRALTGTLEEALAGASIALAFNSNSLTEAVLAGVPVSFADEGAMVSPLRLYGVFRGREGDDPDWAAARPPWAHRLAWTQWSLEEIARGDAWEHVGAAMEAPRWHESFAEEKAAA